MKIGFFLVLLAWVCFCAEPVLAQALPVLAVLELDAKGGISADQASIVTDRIRAHVLQSRQYTVLEREKMQAILNEQGFQQSLYACGANLDCSAQLGKLLGVKYLISGGFSQFEALYILNLRILDVEKGQIIKEEYRDCACPLGQILKQETGKIVQKLLLTEVSQSETGPELEQGSVSQIDQKASLNDSIHGAYASTLAGNGWIGNRDADRAEANLNYPTQLVQQGEELYFTERDSHRLRRISDQKVQTLAGRDWNWWNGEFWGAYMDGLSLEARFNQPHGLAPAGPSEWLIADSNNHRIRVFKQGWVLSWVGTGQAGFLDGNPAVARFNRPQSLLRGTAGQIYVADTDNHAIRVISPQGTVSTLAGNGQAGFVDGVRSQARFHFPTGLALDHDGNLYIADTFNHAIRKLTPEGFVSTVAGTGTAGFREGPAREAQLREPRGVACGPAGVIFLSDTGNHRLRVLAENKLETLIGTGVQGFADGKPAVAQFNLPQGLVYDSRSNSLFLADGGNHRIRQIQLLSSYLPGDFKGAQN